MAANVTLENKTLFTLTIYFWLPVHVWWVWSCCEYQRRWEWTHVCPPTCAATELECDCHTSPPCYTQPDSGTVEPATFKAFPLKNNLHTGINIYASVDCRTLWSQMRFKHSNIIMTCNALTLGAKGPWPPANLPKKFTIKYK